MKLTVFSSIMMSDRRVIKQKDVVYMLNLKEFCKKFRLGTMTEDPFFVTGGLMHRMAHVKTDLGEYAVKILNPDIMKRPTAYGNMVNSEIIAHKFDGIVPLIAAKELDDRHVLEMDGSYFMVYDWLEGSSVFPPDITTDTTTVVSVSHCEAVGQLLGKMHAADVKVPGLQPEAGARTCFNWDLLLEKAQESELKLYSLLTEHISDIRRWDENVVNGLPAVSKDQVISHRDLDPKNIMWKDGAPFVIDWEAAGYVNPGQELLEVLNYWIADENGQYDRAKFNAFMQAYEKSRPLGSTDWNTILAVSFDGMLGWLEYNIKRILKMEGSSDSDIKEGWEQTEKTLQELHAYEAQTQQLKDWLCSRGK